jgi:hypothetical protein
MLAAQLAMIVALFYIVSFSVFCDQGQCVGYWVNLARASFCHPNHCGEFKAENREESPPAGRIAFWHQQRRSVQLGALSHQGEMWLRSGKAAMENWTCPAYFNGLRNMSKGIFGVTSTALGLVCLYNASTFRPKRCTLVLRELPNPTR